MPERSTNHLPAIDRLKGLAILWVICVHAKLGEGSLSFEHLTNRAVPVFLVLFGVTGELWWQQKQESAGERGLPAIWWRSRLARLMVPLWAMAALWWAAVLWTGLSPMDLDFKDALLTFAGYAPWIGTTWFVTLAIQFVLLFPALRYVAARTPPWLTLPPAAALCAYLTWHLWDVVHYGRVLLGNKVAEPGWYYLWIFSPRVFLHVLAGVYFARYTKGRPSMRTTVAYGALAVLSVPVTAFASSVSSPMIEPLTRQMVLYLFDVPLTFALLGLLGWLPFVDLVARPLEWFGRASWGLYLGHVLVHELLHVGSIAPETSTETVKVFYALFLLAVAAGLTSVGGLLLDSLRAAPPFRRLTSPSAGAPRTP